MSDFTSAMNGFLAVYKDELGGKMTKEEMNSHHRLKFLVKPHLEVSDAVYREYREDIKGLLVATQALKKVAADRGLPKSRVVAKEGNFNSAMNEFLKAWQDLGKKVTRAELGANYRIYFLTKPNAEVSDLVYREFHPKKEVAALGEATDLLRKIKNDRAKGVNLKRFYEPRVKKPSMSADTSNLEAFNAAMQEVLKIFSADLGGHVSPMELGPHKRFMFLTQVGAEYSDLLYKEFGARREVGELNKCAQVLRDVAAARKARAAPKVEKDLLVTGTVKTNTNQISLPGMAPSSTKSKSQGMVFDYLTFQMKPISSFL